MLPMPVKCEGVSSLSVYFLAGCFEASNGNDRHINHVAIS